MFTLPCPGCNSACADCLRPEYDQCASCPPGSTLFPATAPGVCVSNTPSLFGTAPAGAKLIAVNTEQGFGTGVADVVQSGTVARIETVAVNPQTDAAFATRQVAGSTRKVLVRLSLPAGTVSAALPAPATGVLDINPNGERGQRSPIGASWAHPGWGVGGGGGEAGACMRQGMCGGSCLASLGCSLSTH